MPNVRSPQTDEALMLIRKLVAPGLDFWEVEDFVTALQFTIERKLAATTVYDRLTWERAGQAIIAIACTIFDSRAWEYAIAQPTDTGVKVTRE